MCVCACVHSGLDSTGSSDSYEELETAKSAGSDPIEMADKVCMYVFVCVHFIVLH